MDWSKGFKAKYYARIVDPESWEDTERIDITSGNISKSGEGLRESADVTCTDGIDGEIWIRVYLDTRQEGSGSHTALFTGVATSPDRNYDGRRKEIPLACYSVLKAADDVMLDRGWYAPKGANGAELAKRLLKMGTPAPVYTDDNSPSLKDYIVAEDNESCLSMADKIITAIGWRIRINGRGEVMLCQRAESAAMIFDPNDNDVIEPQISIKDDWYECPNVLRVVSGDESVTVRDDNPGGMFSTASRGREVWAQETDVKLNDSESLAAYGARRLQELQNHAISISYNRRFNPDVLIGDIVQMNYPGYGLSGRFEVTSQKITLGHGAQTSEEAEGV